MGSAGVAHITGTTLAPGAPERENPDRAGAVPAMLPISRSGNNSRKDRDRA